MAQDIKITSDSKASFHGLNSQKVKARVSNATPQSIDSRGEPLQAQQFTQEVCLGEFKFPGPARNYIDTNLQTLPLYEAVEEMNGKMVDDKELNVGCSALTVCPRQVCPHKVPDPLSAESGSPSLDGKIYRIVHRWRSRLVTILWCEFF